MKISEIFGPARRSRLSSLVLVGLAYFGGRVSAAEFTHNFTYASIAYTNKVYCDDSIAFGQIKGAIVAFNYGGADQAYSLPIWRNFAKDRNLALVLMINQDTFGIPAYTPDATTVLNNTLTAAATGLGHSELSAGTLPYIFVGISRGGTSGAINLGNAYGANRTVACLSYHGNSFEYIPSLSNAAAKAIPVLYPMAQLDSTPARQTDIETAVRTKGTLSTGYGGFGVRPTNGLYWTTTMQYGSSHASLGDDTYPLQWLGRVWTARFNASTPGTLTGITAGASLDGIYTLTNGASSSAYFASLSTATFTQKDGNIWLPAAGASEWLAESTQPLANTPLNIDSAQSTLYTAPDKIINRNFTGAGNIIFSGSGLVQLDNGGSGSPNYFTMTGGTLTVRNGTTLRNGGFNGGVWTNNKASLDIDAASTFDLWDGYAVLIDGLKGAGSVTIGLNTSVNWAGGRSLTLGVNNGSGTFSGTIAGNPSVDGGSISLTKFGTGTQTLASVNTYAGGTTVNAGTLALTGGGTLGGGSVAIANGATLSIGHAAGAIADTAGVSMGATARLDIAAGVIERVASLTINGVAMAKGLWNALRDPAHFSGSGELWVGTPGATALQDWRQSNFGTTADSGNASNTADPDGDGLPNLMEYATGLSPTASGVTTCAVAAVNTSIEFSRAHAAVADGVSFQVEWSDTLGNDWSSSGVVQSQVANSDDGVTTTWKAVLPMSSAGRRFVRLRIVSP